MVCTGSDEGLSVCLLSDLVYVQSDINVAKAQHLESTLRHLVYHMYIGAHETND